MQLLCLDAQEVREKYAKGERKEEKPIALTFLGNSLSFGQLQYKREISEVKKHQFTT